MPLLTATVNVRGTISAYSLPLYPAGTFSWSELVTSDGHGAKAFYTALFGWEYEDSPIGDDMVYSMALLGGKHVGPT